MTAKLFRSVPVLALTATLALALPGRAAVPPAELGRGRGKSGREAGDDLKGHAGFRERGDLLAGTTEDTRIAALEAQH